MLVLARRAQDAEISASVLRRSRLSCVRCANLDELCSRIREGAGTVILDEVALQNRSLAPLLEALREQPPWSDLPFVILTTGGHSTTLSLKRFHALEQLGHITLLERPIRTVTLIASVRAALASRARQYQVRDHLTALMSQAEELSRFNAALEQFAFAAAHDLQEPIRNVSLYTQLLAKRYHGQMGREADHFIRTITEGAERLAHLVQDLLEYTRAVVSPSEPLAEVDCNEAMADVLFNLRTAMESTQARVTYSPLPALAVYRIHITVLLQNLISNGIKYRGARVPCIHVSAERENGWWHFRVRDNGIGIGPQYREKIFGVFTRLHGREIPGTGIGLAICQRIVHHYNGRIWVESEPGEGSVFHFTLPDREETAT